MAHTKPDHTPEECDVVECQWHETCSLCTTMVPISSLKRSGEWEMVCPTCRGLT